MSRSLQHVLQDLGWVSRMAARVYQPSEPGLVESLVVAAVDRLGRSVREVATALHEMLLMIGAAFMGTALTVRDLIGERSIFLREEAVCVSTSAYLLAKIVVFSILAVVESAVMTVIVVLSKGPP